LNKLHKIRDYSKIPIRKAC